MAASLSRLWRARLQNCPALSTLLPQVNDSSAIISRLAAEIDAGALSGSSKGSKSSSKDDGESVGFLAALFGSSSKQQGGSKAASAAAPASPADEEKWRRWVDDWFVKVRAVCLAHLCCTQLCCLVAAGCSGAHPAGQLMHKSSPSMSPLHSARPLASHMTTCLLQVITVDIYRTLLSSCLFAWHLRVYCLPLYSPLLQVITVNIYRNMREAFQTFDYISERGNFGWASREAGEPREGGIGGMAEQRASRQCAVQVSASKCPLLCLLLLPSLLLWPMP